MTPQVDRGGVNQFQLAIISSQKDFYRRMKFLEAQGIPRNKIIDGKIFLGMIDLDFPRLINEGVAYGQFNPDSFGLDSKHGTIASIYPRVYRSPRGESILTIDSKGYINQGSIEGHGLLSVGKYCAISWDEKFKLNANSGHDYRDVTAFRDFDWLLPKEFYHLQGTCKILIGSDVWIGRDCTLKCTNPNKPLVIGDGAVIAADSVVVKSVPPYAIVGGNPAQIIKYRFPPHVIESFLRIKWWDWSLDKIHDNFKFFNDVEKFISLHDK